VSDGVDMFLNELFIYNNMLLLAYDGLMMMMTVVRFL